MNLFPTDKEEQSSASSLFLADQQALRAEVYRLTDGLQPLLRADLLLALQSPGKLLCEVEPSTALPTGSWALLVLYCGLCLDPQADRQRLYHVGIAIECFICALDLFDDVEDEDQTRLLTAIGVPRAVNVATALLALAQQTLSSLPHSSLQLREQLSLTLQTSLLHATEGQHRDLLAEAQSMQQFTQQDCIEIAAQKAGSLMRLACLLGALCVEASEENCRILAEIGHLVGIAAQLDNDCHDLYHLLHMGKQTDADQTYPATLKTDLLRRKKTLPVVIAFQQRDVDVETALSMDRDAQQQFFSEAIYKAWGIGLLYHERALECFRHLEEKCIISPELRALLRMSE